MLLTPAERAKIAETLVKLVRAFPNDKDAKEHVEETLRLLGV